ncbi:hypothetical protein QBC36DRAFT_32693 [Triangularia setosa]|uniref:Uncharacterized protein n=1 Tax=Triangularia setosa TaxID=2587417 RepID=A0AAN7A6A1_9PEZI|nr:hypothetical protein QBC36DRAFT_32693 [Podospora setosa]
MTSFLYFLSLFLFGEGRKAFLFVFWFASSLSSSLSSSSSAASSFTILFLWEREKKHLSVFTNLCNSNISSHTTNANQPPSKRVRGTHRTRWIVVQSPSNNGTKQRTDGNG